MYINIENKIFFSQTYCNLYREKNMTLIKTVVKFGRKKDANGFIEQ